MRGRSKFTDDPLRVGADRIEAILDALADAVTVQASDGQVVYANQAAAELLGFSSPSELVAMGGRKVMARYEVLREDGTPVEPADLPARRVLAGEEPSPLLLRNRHVGGGEERWSLVKATGVRDEAGRVVMAVNIVEDVTDQKRAERREHVLAAAGEALATSLDYEQTLTRVAQVAVPAIADWCAVEIPDEQDGGSRLVALAHSDPARLELGYRIRERFPPAVQRQTGLAQVLRTGRSRMAANVSDTMLAEAALSDEHLELLRAMEMHSVIIVPVRAGPTVYGTLSLIGSRPRPPFDESDRELAEELGRRAGGAVANARLFEERSRLAHTLQQALLPDRLPKVPGWDIANLYRPAGTTGVGGDFYDVFECAGDWYAIVGDVAGKGAEAAALTALARHTLRTTLVLTGDMVHAVRQLDEALRERSRLSLCTAVLVRLRDRAAEILCAGHPPPLLTRGGEAHEVGCYGPLLGTQSSGNWSELTVEIEPGDALTLYTDGVLDTVGAHERFGEERLAQALAVEEADARRLLEALESDLHAFQRGPQADDTAVLVLVHEAGGDPPERSRGTPLRAAR